MELLLNLTQSEIDAISNTANDRRFSFRKEEFLYSSDMVEKLKIFIKCYRFLSLLATSFKSNENYKEIFTKIVNALNKTNSIYVNGEILINSIKKDSKFGNINVNRDIKKLVEHNLETINMIINETFPIGRIVKSYNPDEAAGTI